MNDRAFPGLTSLDATKVRQALLDLPLVAAQETLDPPSLHEVFVPTGHLKALSLDSSVVVGMRGAGKSFWTAVLASAPHREFVSRQAGISELNAAEVRVGFGQSESNEDFPNASTLRRLLVNGISAEAIWLAVVLRHGLKATDAKLPVTGGIERLIEWTSKNSEQADHLLKGVDESLKRRGAALLILFDALDRLADDWSGVRILSGAALKFCLRCRSRRAIRLKFFLRPDLEEDDEIWAFADSSKLRQSKVELNWRAPDLYSLILQHVANSDRSGKHFRTRIYKDLGVEWKERTGFFPVPTEIRKDDEVLRSIAEAITGKLMGKDRKRGYAFTWIPLHLADAKGQVSPRSMLLTFQRGAEWTHEEQPNWDFALHYQGIQQGVAEASKTRTNEIQEDYPWVKPALEAARNLQVPCRVKDLTARWRALSHDFRRTAGTGKLPPRRYTTDPYRKGEHEALLDDLIDLAVLYRTEDARLNMPDIFRVGVGIKRKGGVRPIR